jgi:hypothetical protein
MRAQLRRQTTDRLPGRTRPRRAAPRGSHGRPTPEAIEPVAGRDERRVREAGGPADRALYGCHCGCAFHAPVTASVACPRCGDAQAW